MRASGEIPTTLTYPAELPVTAFRGRILAALASHQVVVVSGDTGSGKTTQLPKMALEAVSRIAGRPGRVAVTQPRRLAAVAMAARVAEELGGTTGGFVGYRHRYAQCLSPRTRVTFVTDGVLLAQTRADPLLEAYDAIVVDEAHERSLTIDFLLGVLSRILARRPELRVVVSSATLDTEVFSAFFSGAPVVSVPGRLHPVEIVYRPPDPDAERDLPGETAAAVAALPDDGDVLCFLPGERDIRETAERLAPLAPGSDVIALLACLPADEQRRAFRLSPRRRVILATNVAETSLTLPGIRYVVDSGLARLSRYLPRSRVQRLQIEPVSQASARQRAGRCGRLGPGMCVRLYSREDFESRERFTPPEILRASLAGVILAMLDHGMGDITRFPFIDPPRPAMVKEGFAALAELGAIETGADGTAVLTPLGRRLARLPVDPHLARMMIAASERATLPSVLPVVAALSCDDPRRRPADRRAEARAAHARFRVPGSDFRGTLALWTWFARETDGLSRAKTRKLCAETYLSYPKMRDWCALVGRLRDLAARIGLDTVNDNGGPDAFHRALLTGLLGRVGRFDEQTRDYRGAHAVRFSIHPGSVLAKKTPLWIVAGEVVETERLYARAAAVVDPAWIEEAGAAVVKRSYRSPEWDPASGFVRALEQVTLYGLPLVTSRRRDYGRIDPVLSRTLFIRFGLVGAAFPRPPPVVRANAALLDEMRARAEKTRRPELFDEAALERFFDAAVPADVASADAFRAWLRAGGKRAAASVALRRETWLADDGGAADGFPASIVLGGVTLALSYRHDRARGEEDGITCTVKRADAGVLRLWRDDWLVPGALPGKLAWLLLSLPAPLRRVLSPVDERVAVLLPRLVPGSEPLEDAVRRAVYAEWGFRIPADAWARAVPPPHLRVRFRLVDGATGKVLVLSRDKAAVLAAAGAAAAGPVSAEKEPSLHATWDFGPLDAAARASSAGWEVPHFAALRDEGAGVTLRLYSDRRTAARVHAGGLVRLFALALASRLRTRFDARSLPLEAAVFLKDLGYDARRIEADAVDGAVRDTLVEGREPVRDAAAFERRLEDGLSGVVRAHARRLALVREAVEAAARTLAALDAPRTPEDTAAAVRSQVAWLVFPGFARAVPAARLERYGRYFRAMDVRLARARVSPSGDRAKEARVAPFWERYRTAVSGGENGARPDAAALGAYRWLVEEYRISVFAQELGTSEPVGPERLEKRWRRVFEPPEDA